MEEFVYFIKWSAFAVFTYWCE